MPTTKPDTLRATDAFTCEIDGRDVSVHAGEVVHADHPVAKGPRGAVRTSGRARPRMSGPH
jgi:hypothetical protein